MIKKVSGRDSYNTHDKRAALESKQDNLTEAARRVKGRTLVKSPTMTNMSEQLGQGLRSQDLRPPEKSTGKRGQPYVDAEAPDSENASDATLLDECRAECRYEKNCIHRMQAAIYKHEKPYSVHASDEGGVFTHLKALADGCHTEHSNSEEAAKHLQEDVVSHFSPTKTKPPRNKEKELIFLKHEAIRKTIIMPVQCDKHDHDLTADPGRVLCPEEEERLKDKVKSFQFKLDLTEKYCKMQFRVF